MRSIEYQYLQCSKLYSRTQLKCFIRSHITKNKNASQCHVALLKAFLFFPDMTPCRNFYHPLKMKLPHHCITKQVIISAIQSSLYNNNYKKTLWMTSVVFQCHSGGIFMLEINSKHCNNVTLPNIFSLLFIQMLPLIIE